jgi:hypothetical protein
MKDTGLTFMVNVSPTGGIILVEDESGNVRADIRVIDFDWASCAGYGLSRNPDIAGVWPGKPGGTINKDHDHKLFQSWWANLISTWVDDRIVTWLYCFLSDTTRQRLILSKCVTITSILFVSAARNSNSG